MKKLFIRNNNEKARYELFLDGKMIKTSTSLSVLEAWIDGYESNS